MITLDVPIFRQRTDQDCSIAAAKMVLEYYQDKVEYEELERAFKSDLDPATPHIQSAATFLVHRGYQVHLQHYDSSLIYSNIESIDWQNTDEVTGWLERGQHEATSEFMRRKAELTLKFVLAGGKFCIQIPDIDLLSNKLRTGIPSIICVELRSFRKNANLNGNHYCVVTGECQDTFFINDSVPSGVPRYDISKCLLRYAWYRTGAYTMIIEPKG